MFLPGPTPKPAVDNRDLIIQRPKIIQVPDAQNAACQQVEYPCNPFPHIQAVHAEQSEKCQQNPGERVVKLTGPEPDAALRAMEEMRKRSTIQPINRSPNVKNQMVPVIGLPYKNDVIP